MSSPVVLIVDDDGDSRLALKAALRKKGYAFLEAEDGEEGIRMVSEQTPDLIIMDVLMPRVNGYEALRRIRSLETARHTPVLMVTALGSMDEKIFALEAGADGLLPKPFDKKALLDESDELLGNLMENMDLMCLRQRRSKELICYYYTDCLTGVPNRAQLIRDIGRANSPGLLLIDINNFKDIVYFYGHKIGDSCLKAFVAKLKGILDTGGYSHYRISGDIFAVLIRECQGTEELTTVMETVGRTWSSSAYLECQGHTIPVWLTIGGSVGETVANHELLNRAEKALKTAKATGRGALLFDDAKEEFHSYEQNIFWAHKISDAIAGGRIVPYFQPIVNNKDGSVEKYECLVRLIEHDGTVVPPASFLDISKRTHHYAAITKNVIAGALRMIGMSPCHFTINLSSRDMVDPEIAGTIYEQLEAFNACERVMFELLESEGVENYDAVRIFIDQVKGYGCKIAIDDFGSGYSNFIHMVRLNVDVIKIDGSLIRDLDRDANARTIVETIVDFAKKMNVQTVAEFVHSESIHRIVTELGVDYSQGYYLGMPKETL